MVRTLNGPASERQSEIARTKFEDHPGRGNLNNVPVPTLKSLSQRRSGEWCPVMLISIVAASSLSAGELAPPVSFVNDVVPVLTKAGCNAGACHAKAGQGQNGFQLSLLGFEPQEDYEHLVKEARGRRVSAASPEQSLILMKASNRIPHGGGLRLDPASEGYRILRAWLLQGTPNDLANAPKLVALEVQPAKKTLKPKADQQLKVTARFADGKSRDVTAIALYEANDRNMAEASEAGRVKIFDQPGNVAVMVRYQDKATTFNVSLPLGATVKHLPAEKNFIDRLVFANLKQLGIPPSPLVDDATFLRRVSLDIAGRLPTTAEAEAFLASKEPAKREQLVDALLTSPDYADFFAGKWSALLKNKRDDTKDITANFAFHSWVRDSLLANKPYDRLVRELLAATGTIADNPPVAWYKRVKQPTEQLEDVAQLFLGVRMQCAQCHHHPFERWSQHDYYSMAAFFSQIGRKPTATAGEDVIFHKRGMAQTENKKTKQPVKPAGLGDPTLDISPDDDPRLRLADWMGDKANPFFAKSLVNRYWKHFFRRGLIEPEDDIRDTNPPSNPELLDALAKHFVESGFDLKAVVRVIAQSSAYQLSAIPNQHNGVDTQNFSRFYPRRMPAEVLLDAVDQFTGARTDFADLPAGTRAIALPDNSYNRSSPFLKVFGRPESASVCECERASAPSLSQSLHLMNASDVKAKLATSGGRAERLAKEAKPEPQKIRELYLAAFAREPMSHEQAVAEEYLARPREDAAGKPLPPEQAKRLAYEDLLWALINTKEFLYNH